MACLKLDGSELAKENGRLVIIRGVEEISQKVSISLQLVLGEWFLNTAEGVPYYEQIFVKNPSPGKITSIFRRAILAVPGMLSVQTITVDFNRSTRAVSVSFFGQATEGVIDFSQAFTPFGKVQTDGRAEGAV
jgi:hypothetical protein